MLLIFVIILIFIFFMCCIKLNYKEPFSVCDIDSNYNKLDPVIAGDNIKDCILNCKEHKDIKKTCDINDAQLIPISSEIRAFDRNADKNSRVILDQGYLNNPNNIINKCINDNKECKLNGKYHPCLEKCIKCRHPIKCNWRYELVNKDTINITGGKLPTKKKCKTSNINTENVVTLYGIVLDDNPPKIKLLWDIPLDKWGSDKKKCGSDFINKSFKIIVLKSSDIANKEIEDQNNLEEVYSMEKNLEIPDVDYKIVGSLNNKIKFTTELNNLHDEHLSVNENDGKYIISLQYIDEYERVYVSNSVEVKLTQSKRIYGKEALESNVQQGEKTALLNKILGKTFEITL